MRALENGRVRFEAVASLRSRLERRPAPPATPRTSRGSGSQPVMTSRLLCAHHGRERGAPFLSLAALKALTADARPTVGGHPVFWNAGAVRHPLGLPDELVGEEGEAVTDCLGIDEAHGFLVAGLAEEALASPEHDREDDQPQLVDQVVLD